MLPLLLLEPTGPQHPRDCARFERLRAALAEAAWDVQIGAEEPARRSAVAEVVVQVLPTVSSTTLDSLEAILVGHLGEALPRGHHRSGRVVIYGAGGDVLRIREVLHAKAA